MGIVRKGYRVAAAPRWREGRHEPGRLVPRSAGCKARSLVGPAALDGAHAGESRVGAAHAGELELAALCTGTSAERAESRCLKRRAASKSAGSSARGGDAERASRRLARAALRAEAASWRADFGRLRDQVNLIEARGYRYSHPLDPATAHTANPKEAQSSRSSKGTAFDGAKTGAQATTSPDETVPDSRARRTCCRQR